MKIQLLSFLLIAALLVSCDWGSDRPDMSDEDLYQEYYGEKGEPEKIDSLFVTYFSGGGDTVTYGTFDGLDIVEGDIIIRDGTVGFEIQANVELGRTWPGGIVPYTLSGSLPGHIRENVLFAIGHWEDVTKLRFKETTGGETNLIRFAPGRSSTIGASPVGMQNGPQTIYLGSKTGKAVAIHEIGHSLGLWHEQSRPDRDTYVTIKWENIRRRNRFNFRQVGTESGPYDFKSRMHYRKDAFTRNGRDTIVPVDPNNVIENDGYLSEGDINAIAKLYGL